MRTQPVEVHIRLKKPRTIAYHRSLGAIDTSRSKHYEDLIDVALNERSKMIDEINVNGRSTLPSIDMYIKKLINGLDVDEAFHHDMITNTQVDFIWRSAQSQIAAILRDRNCRQCIAELRNKDEL